MQKAVKRINIRMKDNICNPSDGGFNIHDILRFLKIHGKSQSKEKPGRVIMLVLCCCGNKLP